MGCLPSKEAVDEKDERRSNRTRRLSSSDNMVVPDGAQHHHHHHRSGGAGARRLSSPPPPQQPIASSPHSQPRQRTGSDAGVTGGHHQQHESGHNTPTAVSSPPQRNRHRHRRRSAPRKRPDEHGDGTSSSPDDDEDAKTGMRREEEEEEDDFLLLFSGIPAALFPMSHAPSTSAAFLPDPPGLNNSGSRAGGPHEEQQRQLECSFGSPFSRKGSSTTGMGGSSGAAAGPAGFRHDAIARLPVVKTRTHNPGSYFLADDLSHAGNSSLSSHNGSSRGGAVVYNAGFPEGEREDRGNYHHNARSPSAGSRGGFSSVASDTSFRALHSELALPINNNATSVATPEDFSGGDPPPGRAAELRSGFLPPSKTQQKQQEQRNVQSPTKPNTSPPANSSRRRRTVSSLGADDVDEEFGVHEDGQSKIPTPSKAKNPFKLPDDVAGDLGTMGNTGATTAWGGIGPRSVGATTASPMRMSFPAQSLVSVGSSFNNGSASEVPGGGGGQLPQFASGEMIRVPSVESSTTTTCSARSSNAAAASGTPLTKTSSGTTTGGATANSEGSASTGARGSPRAELPSAAASHPLVGDAEATTPTSSGGTFGDETHSSRRSSRKAMQVQQLQAILQVPRASAAASATALRTSPGNRNKNSSTSSAPQGSFGQHDSRLSSFTLPPEVKSPAPRTARLRRGSSTSVSSGAPPPPLLERFHDDASHHEPAHFSETTSQRWGNLAAVAYPGGGTASSAGSCSQRSSSSRACSRGGAGGEESFGINIDDMERDSRDGAVDDEDDMGLGASAGVFTMQHGNRATIRSSPTRSPSAALLDYRRASGASQMSLLSDFSPQLQQQGSHCADEEGANSSAGVQPTLSPHAATTTTSVFSLGLPAYVGAQPTAYRLRSAPAPAAAAGTTHQGLNVPSPGAGRGATAVSQSAVPAYVYVDDDGGLAEQQLVELGLGPTTVARETRPLPTRPQGVGGGGRVVLATATPRSGSAHQHHQDGVHFAESATSFAFPNLRLPGDPAPVSEGERHELDE